VLTAHLFVKVPRPGDCEGSFSVLRVKLPPETISLLKNKSITLKAFSRAQQYQKIRYVRHTIHSMQKVKQRISCNTNFYSLNFIIQLGKANRTQAKFTRRMLEPLDYAPVKE